MTEQGRQRRELSVGGGIFVISGPSGVGKNTLADRLCRRDAAVRAVTATTRTPRPGEKDGVDYYFVSEQEFLEWRDAGALLEWNHYGGNWYGTPLFSITDTASAGRPVLVVIDVNGALELKKTIRDAILIFIMPPSRQALLERLRGRGKDDERSIRRRLDIAEEEMKKKDEYDYVVVNGEVDGAVAEMERIIADNA